MGMKDQLLIDTINPTFIALTGMTFHHCVSTWTTGNFMVPPEFGPRGGAKCNCDTRNINYWEKNACTDLFRSLNTDFCSSSPEVKVKKIDYIASMIHRMIHSTGMDPAIAQPQNDQGNFDKNFLEYVPEEQMEQPNNSFNRLSSFVAATEATMLFSAVLSLGGSTISSSSQPIPNSDSNSYSNNITNMTSIENTGLVNGSMIAAGAMSLGGWQWCQ
jgi:hypothetical protein